MGWGRKGCRRIVVTGPKRKKVWRWPGDADLLALARHAGDSRMIKGEGSGLGTLICCGLSPVLQVPYHLRDTASCLTSTFHYVTVSLCLGRPAFHSPSWKFHGRRHGLEGAARESRVHHPSAVVFRRPVPDPVLDIEPHR